MNYLQGKKTKRNKYVKIAVGIFGILLLVLLRTPLFNGFSYVAQVVFHPVVASGNMFGGRLQKLGAYFVSKNSLNNENLALKAQIEESMADRANYASVVAENTDLKNILSRKPENANMVLGAILAKPNQSAYDTLLIDIGSDHGLKSGNKVFALGDIPIGYIAEVYAHTSKVILFSNSGEKTQVVLSGKDTSLELVGRGGGNFEMLLPRDFTVLKYDQVVLPGIKPYVVGIVETIISDQRESFQKALLVTPLNIQSIKFVQVVN